MLGRGFALAATMFIYRGIGHGYLVCRLSWVRGSSALGYCLLYYLHPDLSSEDTNGTAPLLRYGHPVAHAVLLHALCSAALVRKNRRERGGSKESDQRALQHLWQIRTDQVAAICRRCCRHVGQILSSHLAPVHSYRWAITPIISHQRRAA